MLYFDVIVDNSCIVLFNERICLLGKLGEYVQYLLVYIKVEEFFELGVRLLNLEMINFFNVVVNLFQKKRQIWRCD